jgi:hypothetical protein
MGVTQRYDIGTATPHIPMNIFCWFQIDCPCRKNTTVVVVLLLPALLAGRVALCVTRPNMDDNIGRGDRTVLLILATIIIDASFKTAAE